MRCKINAIKCGALFLSLILTVCATAQTSCEVYPEALKGNYTGDCKSEKTNGAGKAIGTDTYEGIYLNRFLISVY